MKTLKKLLILNIYFLYFKNASELNYLITTKKEYTFRLYKREPNISIYVEIMINRGNFYTSKNNSKHIETSKENFFEIQLYLMKKIIILLKY